MELSNIRLDMKLVHYDFEDYQYHNEYNFDVVLTIDDEDTIIGKGSVYLYLTRKMQMDGLTWIYFDDIYGDNHHVDFLEDLFEYDELEEYVHIKDCYYEQILANSTSSNILIPDRLEIYPEYRNKGYGKIVTELIRNMFSDCYGIEVIKAYPLQLEKFPHDQGERAKMKYDLMEQDETLAKESLYRMYESKGYTRIRDTELFYYYPEI